MAVRVSKVYRKRRFARRVKRRGSVSKKIKQYVSKAIVRKKESKFVTSNNAALVVGNNAVAASYLLNYTGSVSQGVSRQQRVGDRITWTYLRGRGTVSFPAGTNGGRLRILLLWVKDTDGILTPADVETDLMDNGGVSPFTQCFLYKRAGCQVLMDRTFSISNNQLGNPATDYGVGQISFASRIKKMNQYVPGSATGDNAKLMLYMVSDQAGALRPTIQGCWRAFYKDDD